MWKEYSLSYIKNNRASGISVMLAAFISALFLFLLCSLFYNFWQYDRKRIEAEEGSWHGRITAEIDAEDLETIQNYANVKTVTVNEGLSEEKELTVDICLENKRRVFQDMPELAKLIGLSEDVVSYHYSLLSMYLIRSSEDTAPRLLFPFMLSITVLACITLVLIIHNSFAVSMQARIHQFGIFSSIGATPKQIRTCLLQEAMALCLLPIAAGGLLGVGISAWAIAQINTLAEAVAGRLEAVWTFHPFVFAGGFAVTLLTVWISARIPAGKLSRMTPLEAIKNTEELKLKRKKQSRILQLLFGVEGELAGNALKAQKKTLRTATLSLTFSFLAFTLMMCFFTLSMISQQMTYFEKYQNSWDVMVTAEDTDIREAAGIEKIQALPELSSAVAYQKAAAKTIVAEEEISEELAAIGGFSNASENDVTKTEDGWLVNAPLIIMDDAGFLNYCEQIGIQARLDGAVIRNQICDFSDRNFRSREQIAYLSGQKKSSTLRKNGKTDAAEEVPVLAYTQEVPLLREEYGTLDYYELVHFLPVSLWEKIKDKIGGTRKDTYIRVLAQEPKTLESLTALQEEVREAVSASGTQILVENRIQDKISNDNMYHGMMILLGGFCVLLAMIGIGSVFTNTLGFVRQRKREFARYLSVGLTPEGLRKMFCIEALVLAGRPVLITAPSAVVLAALMLKASYLDPKVFLREAPVIPIAIFLLAIVGSVSLAYGISWKKVKKISLTEALRDDTML